MAKNILGLGEIFILQNFVTFKPKIFLFSFYLQDFYFFENEEHLLRLVHLKYQCNVGVFQTDFDK